MSETNRQGTSADEFQEWMRSEDIDAIYMDRWHEPEPLLSEALGSIRSECLDRGSPSGKETTRAMLAHMAGRQDEITAFEPEPR